MRNKNNNFVATVRFDLLDPDLGNYRISIHLAANYRGKGLGTKIIRDTTQKLLQDYQVKKISAFIKEDNIPSIKSFEKAAYVYVGKSVQHDSTCIEMQYQR